MRFACCFLMMMTFLACGKKQDSGPEPPAAAAQEEKPSDEKSSDMTAPEPVATPPATGEVARPAEEPPGTGDATPANQAPRLEDKVKTDPVPGPTKDTTTVSPPPPGISTQGAFGGKGAGGSVGGVGGGTGGGVDQDEAEGKLKRSPKKDAKATGYHDKEQDEPTQE